MNLLDPTNHRISNSLFDAINKVRHGEPQQLVENEETSVEEGRVDGAHYCATHVEHFLYGEGECISEDHAEPDENGNISWYNVKFLDGNRRIQTEAMKIKKAKMHEHAIKDGETIEEADTVEEALSGNQHKIDANKNNKIDAHDFKLLRAKKKPVEEGNDGNLANNAKPYGKVTRRDIIHGATGRDEMGGKKKVKEEDVKESRSKGTAFDMSMPSQIPKAPGALTGHTAKKTKTGVEYTKNPPKQAKDTGVPHSSKNKAMKEGISQTVINYNDFVLEVTNNPTYGDYLKALQSMVGESNEELQKDIVSIATEAFNEKYEDVIIESHTKQIFENKFKQFREAGAKVVSESYMVESGDPYVEYVLEKNGERIQYIHIGTIEKK
jgi:hypothetical protein